MKLIENSIESDQLQTSISQADLENSMASCNLETMNSVDQSKKESSPENVILEKVVKGTKLSNGICSHSQKHNDGYLDEDGTCDEDFQLVLESSSEDGGSPVKKIYDGISAPQIVQEIEDLLGIDANSVGIDEELEKDIALIDDSEKEDDFVEEIRLPSAVSNHVSPDNEKNEGVICSSKEENKDNICGLNKSTEETECDSSSNMNLVFDEVEIGMDVVSDVEGSSESSKNSSPSSNIDVIDHDIKGENNTLNKNPNDVLDTEIIKESEKNYRQENIVDNENGNKLKPVENSLEITQKVVIPSVSSEMNSEEGDISLSQGTNKSDSSVEWVVVDAVESSEDDVNVKGDKSVSNGDLKIDNKYSESTLCSKHISVQSKDALEHDVKSNSSNSLSSSGTPVHRKRTAPDEEKVDGKKPKLELESNDLAQQCSQAVKRPSEENDMSLKRSRLDKSDNTHISKDECHTMTEAIENNTTVEKESCDKDLTSNIMSIDMICTDNESEIKCKEDVKVDISSTNISDVHPDRSTSCSKWALEKLKEEEKTTENNEVNGGDLDLIECLPKSECDSIDSKLALDKLQPSLKCDKLNGVVSEPTESKLASDESQPSLKCGKPNEVVKDSTDCKLATDKSQPTLKCDKLNEVDKDSTDCKLATDKSQPTLKCDKLNEVVKDSTDCKLNSDKSSPTLKCDKINEAVTNSTECKVASDEPQQSLECDKPREAVKESSMLNTVSDDIDVLVVDDNKDTSDENKENVEDARPSSSKEILNEETSLKLKVGSTVDVSEKNINKEKLKKSNLESKLSDVAVDEEDSKSTNVSNRPTKINKDSTSKIKEIKVKHNGQFKGEKMKIASKSPFEQLSKNMAKQSEEKQMSNMDNDVESVVGKARKHEASTHLPVLTRFHKDQLRRLTRSQLEEAVVLKICEAITDRSEIGQMRLRCKNLEQSNELWKKKAAQFEKQNRELEMVLKRYLNETAHIKKDNLNKMALPIKVTRSVGLQVVLASSVQGSLVTSRNKTSADTSRSSNQQHQSQFQTIRPKPTPEPQRQKSNTPQVLPKRLGLPSKIQQSSTPSTSNDTPSTSYATPSTSYATPSTSNAKPAVPPVRKAQPSQPAKTPVTTKTISTPTKDLEVIDLTDKEDKAKAPSPQQTPVGIRVTPSSQVCFVQSSTPSTSTKPMTYLVQKAGQRQQYLVATTSPSPPRPAGTISTQQASGVTLPVFRAGGQIFPVQNNTPVGVRTSKNTVVNATRPMPPAIRLQAQAPPIKHPAPLPSTPVLALKPGLKAPPPKPQLKIAKTNSGIMLSWSMTLTKDIADMALYQLYAYQEGMQPPSTNLWKKVGDVKALPLPMACTLTQFVDGHKYHFAVRAVDIHGRPGPFSHPNTILLQ